MLPLKWIQINYNDKDKYYLLLTTKRGEMVKKGLKNTKSIKVNNISISYDSFNFKSQTSSMKITCEFIDKLFIKSLF